MQKALEAFKQCYKISNYPYGWVLSIFLNGFQNGIRRDNGYIMNRQADEKVEEREKNRIIDYSRNQ